MDFSHLLLLLWAGLIFWELGQIWLVQIVVYPLFAKVGAMEYVSYHRFYTRRIPLPVIVPGFASFLLPLPLAVFGPAVPLWMSATNVAAGIVAQRYPQRLPSDSAASRALPSTCRGARRRRGRLASGDPPRPAKPFARLPVVRIISTPQNGRGGTPWPKARTPSAQGSDVES